MRSVRGFTLSQQLAQRSVAAAAATVVALLAAANAMLAPRPLVAAVQTQARSPQLSEPQLPAVPFHYSDASVPLPRQLLRAGPNVPADNTPPHNRITDAGATLGRVLFYDTRLSANNTTSCGSCHMQEFGFSDTARFSVGLNGERTKRHSMALGNARFYSSGRFFWDERAASLEEQVLMPVQDKVEMGMTLEALVPKLQSTRFYPPLFEAAFGSTEVTSERIALALAQFVRALISSPSSPDPRPARVTFSPARIDAQGPLLFQQQCATCHVQTSHSMDKVHNTGLDSTITDAGAGGGRFKAPSLRNVAVRAPYMHDGRFSTLLEVVEFYNSGIKNNANLDPMFRRADGTPDRMNLTDVQKAALVGYMETFTDGGFLAAERFSNPFPKRN